MGGAAWNQQLNLPPDLDGGVPENHGKCSHICEASSWLDCGAYRNHFPFSLWPLGGSLISLGSKHSKLTELIATTADDGKVHASCWVSPQPPHLTSVTDLRVSEARRYERIRRVTPAHLSPEL